MTAIEVFAPAKVNLSLHVTGQRADGYHLLDSLVVFCDVGDQIALSPATETTLSVTGPFSAGVPCDGRNLVLQAAELMGVSARIRLEKHLPAAAGIGGGSADAAATLRGLSGLFDRPMPAADAILGLGADVPVCLLTQPARMRGIGEEITRVRGLDLGPLLLINPRVSVPTGAVFTGLARKDNPPMPDALPEGGQDVWLTWLAAQRNDLQAPAIAAQPVIGDVLRVLQDQSGCHLARMSGSGATCFAVFADEAQRDRAAAAIKHTHPGWWIAPCACL